MLKHQRHLASGTTATENPKAMWSRLIFIHKDMTFILIFTESRVLENHLTGHETRIALLRHLSAGFWVAQKCQTTFDFRSFYSCMVLTMKALLYHIYSSTLIRHLFTLQKWCPVNNSNDRKKDGRSVERDAYFIFKHNVIYLEPVVHTVLNYFREVNSEH